MIISVSFIIVNSVNSFLNGKALISSGYGSFGKLDKNYRIKVVNEIGCSPEAFSMIKASINNFTVKSLTSVFGFQKETYTGKYFPDKNESIKTLNNLGEIIKIQYNEEKDILELELNILYLQIKKINILIIKLFIDLLKKKQNQKYI